MKTNIELNVEEFLADLLTMGLRQDQACEKGYDYALALQTDQQPTGSYVSASMMKKAAKLVKNALPRAYSIYQRQYSEALEKLRFYADTLEKQR